MISVGDAVFREKASEYFNQLIGNSSVLLCSHNLNTIRKNCNKCYVIKIENYLRNLILKME